MESTNLHEEEEYEQQVQDEASPYFSVETHHHPWRPPNFLLNNNNNIHASCEEEITSASSIMIQNMGNFGWANPNINLIDDQQTLISTNKMIIKQESTSSSSSSNFLLHHQNLSPSNLELLKLHRQEGNIRGMTTNFSQIFPTVNIPGFNNNNESSNISELDLNLRRNPMNDHELDAFTTARLINEGNLINRGIAPSNTHLLELFKLENHHHLHQQSNSPSSFDNNGFRSESNGPSCVKETKSTHNHQTVSKKQRFESRSSCPPFKVRKEKLGDRIAALQQLVAPFGKTDTASVLMEAFGYIKFLQNQVETLSVPYMKLSALRNKSRTKISEEDCENGDEQIPELRSRGLCLVPISCITYLAGDACNGAIWPPPNFHHGF